MFFLSVFPFQAFSGFRRDKDPCFFDGVSSWPFSKKENKERKERALDCVELPEEGYQNGWFFKMASFFFYLAFWYPLVLVPIWVSLWQHRQGYQNGWVSKWKVFDFET